MVDFLIGCVVGYLICDYAKPYVVKIIAKIKEFFTKKGE